MALEAELREKVEQSVRDLDAVLQSLQEVKRLADSNQASAAELAKVTATMTLAGGQIRALLESVNRTGEVLNSAAATLKAADPAPAMAEVKAAVSQSRDATVALKEALASMDRRIDAMAKLYGTKFDQNGEQMESVGKRLGVIAIGVWIAVLTGGIGAGLMIMSRL